MGPPNKTPIEDHWYLDANWMPIIISVLVGVALVCGQLALYTWLGGMW